MRKKIKIYSVSIVLALVMTILLGTTLIIGFGANNSKVPQWSDVEILNEYQLGDVFTVPARSVKVGDKTENATSVLTYPDGVATLKKDVNLSLNGDYVIEYTAKALDKVYKTTEKFTVNYSNYSIGKSSTATYGLHPSAKSKKGLMVKLAAGDSINFNSIIDVQNVTALDPLVELFVTPSNKGILDFEKLIFTFTDVENPDVKLNISARQSIDGINYPYTYFLAGANGQPMMGWEENWQRLHRDNEWGTGVYHSFYGVYSDKPNASLDDVQLSVRFDAVTKSVYANSMIVADLDSSKFFSKLWNGFPSKKVRLSVSANIYIAQTANFVITKVRGVDLAADKLTEDTPPLLKIETDYDTMPTAKVGKTYLAPTATAFDEFSGKCSVKTTVWYDYASDNALLVILKDNIFATERAGYYAIVYEASDRLNNVARKILWVKCNRELAEPKINVTTDGRVTTAILGEFVPVAAPIITGGSGNSQYKITAKSNGKETPIENGFTPTVAGEYTITYSCIDYIGQESSMSYTVTVTKGTKPIFVTEPLLPPCFVSGNKYILPAYFAKDYTGAAVKDIAADIKIKDSNGEHTYKSGEAFTPVVSNNGDSVIVTFLAGEATKVKEIKAITPLVSDGDRLKLKLENYLVTQDAVYEKNDNGIIVKATNADTSWLFARELLAESFMAELEAIPEKSKFKGIKITMRDYANSDIAIEAVIRNNDGRSNMIVNGDINVSLESGFNATAKQKTFKIGYANKNLVVGTAKIPIITAANGEKFNGFTSQFITLEVAFVGASSGAAYSINSINDQPINNATTDRIKPKIVVLGDYGGCKKLGEKVTLPIAIAADVLDPSITFSLTVTDSENKIISDVNGIKLENVSPAIEYTISLEKYGQYHVSYSAKDTNNEKVQNFDYALNVEDDIAPEIIFSGDFDTTAKINDVIVIPNFKVTDNIDSADKITVTKYVLTSNGLLVSLEGSSNSFKVTHEGVYQFRILAVDSAGNVKMIRHNIKVSA